MNDVNPSSFIRHGKTKASGFSLVEMLAAVAILAVLAALTIPAVNRAKASGQTAKCSGNIRQLLGAFQMYATENNGSIPYSNENAEWWPRKLAPYVGLNWDNAFTTRLSQKKATLPEVFHCPSDPWWGKTWVLDASYGYNIDLAPAIPESFAKMPPEGYPDPAKLVAVAHPSEMIVFADSGHLEEDGDVALRIQSVNPVHAIKPRHTGCANIGWLDGHVTLETAKRIDDLQKEPSPRPHWRISQ